MQAKGQKTLSFECCICGQARPLAELAGECLEKADTTSRVTAVSRLNAEDLVCLDCSGENEEPDPISLWPMSDRLRFELDGLVQGPGMAVFYALNY